MALVLSQPGRNGYSYRYGPRTGTKSSNWPITQIG
uniref:Uncharacterized protein n=1 Tax=Anguilla anguilla TaxID=7936 RepID=A0A0E9SEL1_ANGAN